MDGATRNRFPLLHDLGDERPEDVPALVGGFTQAMFVPVQRDYTKPPPPQPNHPKARLQARLDRIDRHAAAVNQNFHYMTQREARRIANHCEEEEIKLQELNEVDHLPPYGLGGGEDGSTLDLDKQLSVDCGNEHPDKFSLPSWLPLEITDARMPQMPRRTLESQTMHLFSAALKNMDGHARASQHQKEALEREYSFQMGRGGGEFRPGSAASSYSGTASSPGRSRNNSFRDAMDTSAD